MDDEVVVELKSSEQIHPVLAKQVTSYLVILHLHLGLIVNFGLATVKEGFVRIVNGYH